MAKSSMVVTSPSASVETAISSTLVAKITGSESLSPSSTTAVIWVPLAEANTDAGAPSMIWVARAELAPKDSSTSTPSLAASNSAAMSVKTSVSEAAPKTRIGSLGASASSSPPQAAASRVRTASDGQGAPHEAPPGVSTMTLVAFTTATA